MFGINMSAFFACTIAFLAIFGHSNGAYCVCKDGASDAQLQKNIDYACGSGADCNPILQNGPCFNPNTVKDHCHWAVNSYYQRKGQAGASCDFMGTATLSLTAPSQSSSCFYPASPGNAGSVSGTPTTNQGNTPATTTPGTGTGMGAGIGGTPSPNTFPVTTPGGFGLAPAGVGSYGDGTGSASQNFHYSNLSVTISLALLLVGLMFPSS